MSETTRHDQRDAGWYEIRLKGHLESRWAAWFDGMSLTSESGGITLVHGRVVDQAHVHGLLQKGDKPLIVVTTVRDILPGWQPNQDKLARQRQDRCRGSQPGDPRCRRRRPDP